MRALPDRRKSHCPVLLPQEGCVLAEEQLGLAAGTETRNLEALGLCHP